jgi:hypothetical protein
MADDAADWVPAADAWAPTVLTADDPRAPDPPGFRGRLFAPQKTFLAHMLRLEARPLLRVCFGSPSPDSGLAPADARGVRRARASARADAARAAIAHSEERLLHTSCALIGAEFSFGKTVLCVALICASPRPKAFAPSARLMAMAQGAGGADLLACDAPSLLQDASSNGIRPTISVRYRREVPATLVVAAPSIISQWERCVADFAPHLRHFTIDHKRGLDRFQELFRAGRAGEYDVVFLKAGQVAGTFTVPGEPKTTWPAPPPRQLTSALACLTEGFVWRRLIVDDFDTIGLNHRDVCLPAVFTWVISATMRNTSTRRAIAAAPSVEAFVRANLQVPMLAPARDALFRGALKIQCAEDYVAEHINTTSVRYRRIVVESDRAAGFLEDLGVPEDVLEMVAAGAVETAARALDIQVDTVGGLFARVLDSRLEAYRATLARLDFAAAVRARAAAVAAAAVAAASPAASPAAAARANTAREVAEIVAAAAASSGPDATAQTRKALALVRRMGPALDAALKTFEARTTKERDRSGAPLVRLRDNLREGQCQACMVPLGGDDSDDEEGAADPELRGVYIMTCCQIVVCPHCVIRSDGGRGRRFILKCPNCSHPVCPAKSFVFIGADPAEIQTKFDLGERAAADLAAEAAGAAAGAAAGGAIADADDMDPFAAWKAKPRLRALLQYLLGAPIAALSDGEISPIVSKLIEGRREAPLPPEVGHKTLIFTMFDESSRNILRALEQTGLSHCRLAGTRQQRDRVVDRFKRRATAPGEEPHVDVLVATTGSDCSGLHLPEVTRLVLFHRHRDQNVAEQAVGRAQRLGREYSLEVVEFASRNEL